MIIYPYAAPLVRIESAGAIKHLNKLTQRHLGKEKWYGDVVPENEDEEKDEVVVYLRPDSVYFT